MRSRLEARQVLSAAALGLLLLAPATALADEGGRGTRASDMRSSISLGLGKVDNANSYTLELDFIMGQGLLGLGFFLIDSGNLPSGLWDGPPPPGADLLYLGEFDGRETGGYVRLGRLFSNSGLRVFGLLGASDVTRKHVVRSASTGTNYVLEEERVDFQMVLGGGLGYMLTDNLLLQYQYDNRREHQFIVGIGF